MSIQKIKMYCFGGLCALAATLSQANFAENCSFYIGGNLGYAYDAGKRRDSGTLEIAGVGSTVEVPERTSSIKKHAFSGGLFTGCLFDCGNAWLMGPEFSADFSPYKTSMTLPGELVGIDPNTTFRVKMPLHLGAKIRFGRSVSYNDEPWFVYGFLGYQASQAKYHTHNDDAITPITTNKTQWMHAFKYGIGVEKEIARNQFLGLEFSHALYGRRRLHTEHHSVGSPYTDAFLTSYRPNILGIGARYTVRF